MRGRNRKGQNPLTRIYESNGPDVKIRGTASHVADKYVQLARDAQTSGDPVAAENYFQHAEHYFRLIASAQEQFRQSPSYYRPEGEPRDDNFDAGDDDNAGAATGGPGDAPFAGSQPYPPREAQPFGPREAQAYPPREGNPPYPSRESQPYGPRDQQPYAGRPQPSAAPGRSEAGDAERLPAFITGGGQPQPYQGYGQNGFDGQPDRFPLHRRRRRRHGPRVEGPGAPQAAGDAPEESTPQPSPTEPGHD